MLYDVVVDAEVAREVEAEVSKLVVVANVVAVLKLVVVFVAREVRADVANAVANVVVVPNAVVVDREVVAEVSKLILVPYTVSYEVTKVKFVMNEVLNEVRIEVSCAKFVMNVVVTEPDVVRLVFWLTDSFFDASMNPSAAAVGGCAVTMVQPLELK